MAWRQRVAEFMKQKDETVGSKLLLLCIEKLVLAALAAIAFVVYDRNTTRQREEAEERRLERSLELERARLAKELLPAVFETEASPEARGHMLRAAVATKALTPAAVLNVAFSLRDQGLAVDQFADLAAPLVLDAFDTFMSEAEGLARKEDELWSGKSQDVLESQVRIARNEHSKRAMSLAFLSAIERNGGEIDDLLQSKWPESVSTVYFLVATGSHALATERSRSDLPLVRLAAALDRLHCDPLDADAAAEIGSTIADDMSFSKDFALTARIVELLRKPRPRAAQGGSSTEICGPITEYLARVVADDRVRVQWPHSRGSRLSERLHGVQRSAGELLVGMSSLPGSNGPRSGAREAVPSLMELLKEFRQTVNAWESDEESMENLSQMFDKGKILLLAIKVVGNDGTPEGLKELKDVRSLPDDVWRHFPGLVEEIDTVMAGKR